MLNPKETRNQAAVLVLILSTLTTAFLGVYRLGVNAGISQGEITCANRQAELRNIVDQQISKTRKAHE